MSLSATPFPLFTFPQRVRISLIWHLINNGPCFPQIFLQANPIILGVWSLICLRSEHCGIKTQRKSCSDSMANQIWICISDMRFHTNTHRWGVGGGDFQTSHWLYCDCKIWFWSIAESGSDYQLWELTACQWSNCLMGNINKHSTHVLGTKKREWFILLIMKAILSRMKWRKAK